MMKYYPAFSYGWLFIADALVQLERTNEAETYLIKAETSLLNNIYLTKEEIEEIVGEIAQMRK